MADEQTWTECLRARGKAARGRLVLSWRPDGRTRVGHSAEDLVRLVEIATMARALELVERAAAMPEGLASEEALGWRAGAEATAGALRRAVEHQAGLLPSESPPRPRRRHRAEPYVPPGIDWF